MNCPTLKYRLRAYGATVATTLAALSSSVVLLLGGCASPAGIAPQTKILTPAQIGLATSTDAQPGIAADWWRGFGDAALDTLVERALTDSPSLQIVQARLARSSAGVAAEQANVGLQANGSFEATRQRFSANSIYPPPLGGSVLTTASLQTAVSWEADFFGRHRAAIEAAVGTERATQADLQAARTLLASQVARAYVQLGRLFDQRTVTQRALAQREEILALIRQRVQGGLDTNVELRQGEAALTEVRQQVEQIDEQITLARHALAALTAQPPARWPAWCRAAFGRCHCPTACPPTCSARRADIAAARWRIEAAGSDMDSLRAAFYPNINLGAFVGLSSIGLDDLLKAGSQQYGVGPGPASADLRQRPPARQPARQGRRPRRRDRAAYNGAVGRRRARRRRPDRLVALDRAPAGAAAAGAEPDRADLRAGHAALPRRPVDLPHGAERRSRRC